MLDMQARTNAVIILIHAEFYTVQWNLCGIASCSFTLWCQALFCCSVFLPAQPSYHNKNQNVSHSFEVHSVHLHSSTLCARHRSLTRV